MKSITIYTKSWCSYCHAAKELLRRKGWTFTEIDVTTDPEGRKPCPSVPAGAHPFPRSSLMTPMWGDATISMPLNARASWTRWRRPEPRVPVHMTA